MEEQCCHTRKTKTKATKKQASVSVYNVKIIIKYFIVTHKNLNLMQKRETFTK